MSDKHHISKTGVIISTIAGVAFVLILIVAFVFNAKNNAVDQQGTKDITSSKNITLKNSIVVFCEKAKYEKVNYLSFDKSSKFNDVKYQKELVKENNISEPYYRTTINVKFLNLSDTPINLNKSKISAKIKPSPEVGGYETYTQETLGDKPTTGKIVFFSSEKPKKNAAYSVKVKPYVDGEGFVDLDGNDSIDDLLNSLIDR